MKKFRQFKTIKVGEDAIGADSTHYALVKDRKVIDVGEKQDMLDKSVDGGRVWVSTKQVGDVVEGSESWESGYKEKPSQAEFNKQIRRVAGHEFGG